MKLKSNLTVFGKRQWSEQDRQKLLIAYQNGFDLRSIGRLVNRSISACNKALSRFGYRDRFGHQKEILKNRRQALSYAEVSAALQNNSEQTNQMSRSYVSAVSTHKKMPIPVLQTCDASQIRFKSFLKKSEIIIKFKQLTFFAKQIGLCFEPLKHIVFNKQGFFYHLNHQPFTNAQMLVLINKKRLALKLPILHVNEITQV